MSDIHTCSYYCDRPACIRAQRDELRDKLQVIQAQAGDGEEVGVLIVEYFNGNARMQNVEYKHIVGQLPEGRHFVYTRPQPQVNKQLPEGYVPVPLEPTEAMIDAGVAVAFAASVHGKGGWNNYMKALYRAFIAAAQEGK